MFKNIRRIFFRRTNPFNFVNAYEHNNISNSFATPLPISLYSTGKSWKLYFDFHPDYHLRADPMTHLGLKYMFKINKDVLIDFLVDALKKPIVDVQFDQTVREKWGVLNFSCRVEDGPWMTVKVQLLSVDNVINVPIIASFDALKTYVDQLHSEQQYSELKPVIMIFIADYNILPETEAPQYCSYHKIVNPRTEGVSFQDVELVLFELPKFKKDVTQLSTLCDNLEVWSYFLKFGAVMGLDVVEILGNMKPCIQKAADSMRKSNWDMGDRFGYDKAVFYRMEEQNRKMDVKRLVKRTVNEMCAKNMLAAHYNIAEISEMLDMSVSEIEKLKEEMNDELNR